MDKRCLSSQCVRDVDRSLASPVNPSTTLEMFLHGELVMTLIDSFKATMMVIYACSTVVCVDNQRSTSRLWWYQYPFDGDNRCALCIIASRQITIQSIYPEIEEGTLHMTDMRTANIWKQKFMISTKVSPKANTTNEPPVMMISKHKRCLGQVSYKSWNFHRFVIWSLTWHNHFWCSLLHITTDLFVRRVDWRVIFSTLTTLTTTTTPWNVQLFSSPSLLFWILHFFNYPLFHSMLTCLL